MRWILGTILFLSLATSVWAAFGSAPFGQDHFGTGRFGSGAFNDTASAAGGASGDIRVTVGGDTRVTVGSDTRVIP